MREHGCRFQFDFASVYWNSRLQGEHARMVELIVRDAKLRVISRRRRRNVVAAAAAATGDATPASTHFTDKREKFTTVADAMAGVGPFAIPLTSPHVIDDESTRIVCHANDLNPVSYEYLQANAKQNKSPPDRLYMYNLDARQFIHKMNDEGVDVDHFIMNLPQLAPEFLDAFRGWRFQVVDDDGNRISNANASMNTAHLLMEGEAQTQCRRVQQPMIHVHCFGEKPRSPEDVARVERQVQQRCEIALGCTGCFNSSVTPPSIERDITSTITSSPTTVEKNGNKFSIRVVRNVGPNKNMLCVSFRLPLEVGGVTKVLISNADNTIPLLGVVDATSSNCDHSHLADASSTTVGTGSDVHAKRGNDVPSEAITSQRSKLMRSI